VLVDAFSAPDVLPLFRRHGVTMVGGSTAFYVAYLAEQRKDPSTPILPTLRLMSGGGAAKPPGIHYEVRDEIGGRGVVHGYGMTEVPMIAQGSPTDSDEQLANTDGKPVEGAEVRIVTLDGRVAGPGEEGEVRVRGPMVFHGYTDPALTADAFDGGRVLPHRGPGRAAGRRACRPDRSPEGRHRPQGGEHQRQGDRGPPLHHPKVIEVAVVGIPDATRGEMVCAVVQLAEGAEGLDLAEVVAFCRQAGLMTQKIPERVEIRTEWPRAGTGKIVKKALRDEYSRVSGRAPVLPTLPAPSRAAPARIVFVCTGNICRSPMAEVAARTMAAATTLVDGTTLGDQLHITSAGTGGWHEGEPMDPRTGAALRRAGYPGPSAHRPPDLEAGTGEIDLVVALDRRHQQTLRSLGADPSRLVLLRSFDPSAGAATDVPDPYYGDDAEFDDCLAMIARGCRGLMTALASFWDAAPSP
jgi:protein-tyrosine-phosphatase